MTLCLVLSTPRRRQERKQRRINLLEKPPQGSQVAVDHYTGKGRGLSAAQNFPQEDKTVLPVTHVDRFSQNDN